VSRDLYSRSAGAWAYRFVRQRGGGAPQNSPVVEAFELSLTYARCLDNNLGMDAALLLLHTAYHGVVRVADDAEHVARINAWWEWLGRPATIEDLYWAAFQRRVEQTIAKPQAAVQ
jgi:hypothetical protein